MSSLARSLLPAITIASTLLVLCTYAEGQDPAPAPASAAAAVGTATAAAEAPWTWPKHLVELKFGEKTRYRETDYWVAPILGKGGEVELLIYRGLNVHKRFLADGGCQFAILDVDTPMPTCEGWGGVPYDHAVRWLMSAFAMPYRGEVGYGWIYLEVYTANPTEAKGEEVHRVSRRPGEAAREYRYFGWAEKYDPKDATKLLEAAKAIQQ